MLIRTPFTDLVSVLTEAESNRNCQKLSMQLALCREAYGMHRPEKCENEYEDFKECIFGFKQASVPAFVAGFFFALQEERMCVKYGRVYPDTCAHWNRLR
ncbi:hypothetical protein HPB51_022140 [Rhipicephalus microplus]|uniref:NADH dehydrogenase [ubiquinone] iron-sulfur protein 5 n=1 Tax=Rhipicephalus microplus TaxID=6941 RepID=A0A9J6EC47_RHIMP|nr:hypothetical protein HPB51_022140 [Rhipicephalus microplus]